MGATSSNFNQETRVFFLKQNHSIEKLYHILNSELFVYHIKKWLSIVIETILYLFFAALIIMAVILPVEISTYVNLSDADILNIKYHDDYFTYFMVMLKAIVLLASIPVFFFALVLGRARRRNDLMQEAFIEVKKMKQNFDGKITDLNN